MLQGDVFISFVIFIWKVAKYHDLCDKIEMYSM